MRGWKFVAILSVLISALSIYQLSFTFKSKSVDEDAENYALIEGENLKITNPNADQDSAFKKDVAFYKDSLWEKEIYLGKNLKTVKKFALNLGLDLQGGINATTIVSPDDILKSLSGANPDPVFNESVEAAKQSMRSESARFTDLFKKEWDKRSGGRDLNEIFLSPDNDEITLETSDDDILKIVDRELDDALDRSVIVLRSRIDKFGATNPIIHPIKSTGRIEIELPGADDEERIRQQISKVAELELLEPQSAQLAQTSLQNIATYYQSLVSKNKIILDSNSTAEDSLAFAEDTIPAISELQKVLIPISREGDFGVPQDKIKRARELLTDPAIDKFMSPGTKIMFASTPTNYGDKANPTLIYPIYFMKKGATSKPIIDGGSISNASPSRDQYGKPAVSISMDALASQKWSAYTESHIGQLIMVVLDNEVYSAANIQAKISGGSTILTGNFTAQESRDLANILKAGKLPAPIIIESLVNIGPSLGAAAIQQGLTSLIAGLLIVVLFMIAYYSKGGVVANIALLFNIFFIVGVLATPTFGVTLTLSGIAGIVLTIGMSIDANVLIFERIKEELALGRTKENAINTGYAKAFWTIFDANITTFLSALVLYLFGTGIVKGFAVTLMIGVVCSFFAAVFITRLFIYLTGRNKKYENMSFSTGLAEKLFSKGNINFMAKRKIGYIFSAIVIAAGIGLMAKDGLNLGVAFKGGFSYVISFDNDVNPTEIRSQVKAKIGDADVQVKSYDTNNKVSITTSYLVDSDEEGTAKKVQETILSALSSDAKVDKSVQVGATIADDIKRTSFQSIVIALVIIFLYIIVRFRKWQFGLGSLIALFHDVFFVLSIFAISSALGFSFEIDEVFIAAVLTLVGYSINDTVVVFDRVRESLGINPEGDLAETLNEALNKTLSRTIMTSVTTLIVVVVLLAFGGEALRGFSFALLVGVLIGTYSSIFIATPVILDTSGNKKSKKSVE